MPPKVYLVVLIFSCMICQPLITNAQNPPIWALPGFDDKELAADILSANQEHKPYLAINLVSGVRRGSIGIPARKSIFGFAENLVVDVVQVIDSENVILSNNGIDIWLSGINTSTMTDDSRFLLDSTCKSMGTKSYTTVLGSLKTVLHLEIVEMPSDLQELQEKLAENPPKESNLRIRNWHIDKDVKDKTESARFLSFDGKELELELQDQTIIRVPAKKLPNATKSAARRLTKFLDVQRKKAEEQTAKKGK